MRSNEPTEIAKILDTLKSTTKLGEQLEQAQIWEHWTAIAGPHLSEHGRPKSVKNGRLQIEADSAVWMHRFSYHKWDIIRRVNRIAGKELIHDVFVALLADGEAIEDDT